MSQREELILEITAKLDEAKSEVTDLQAQLDALAAPTEVEIVADADDATETIGDLAETTEDLADTEVEIPLEVDDEATEPLEEITELTEDLDGAEAEITLEADDEATDILDDAAEAVEDLDGASAEVDLEADDQATDAIEDAVGALEDFDGTSATATMEVEGADEANEAIGGMLENLGTLGAGTVTGLAAGAIASVFEGAAENVLAIQGLADATGDTLEYASGVVEQFDFVGLSASQVQTMVGRVNDALTASPELARRLGINLGESQSPLDTLVQTVDALNSGQLDAGERLTLATDIFGRKGVNAVNAINTQVGDLSQAIEDIPEWQVVTDEDVASAIEFKQTMDEIGDLAAEAAQQFLTKFGPAISNTIRLAEDLGSAIGDVKMAPADSPIAFLEGLDDAAWEEITQNFVDLGGNYEHLLQNSLDLKDATALLDLGIPPEVIARAELTGGAYDALGEAMADTTETAAALHQAFVDQKVSQEEWLAIVADGVITMGEVEAAINDTDVALADSTETNSRYADQLERTAAFQDEIADKVAAAREEHERMTLTTDELAEAMAGLVDPMTVLPGHWETLIRDIADGNLDFENSIELVNQLADATKIAPDKIIEMADAEAKLREQKLNEQLEADAAAMIELANATIEANIAMDSGEGRADAYAAALERTAGAGSELTQGLEVTGFVDDLNAMGDAIAELDVEKLNLGQIDLAPPADDWQAWLNMPDEAQGVLDALSTFRGSIQSEMTQAFAAGGEPGVRTWAANTRQAIVDELAAAGVTAKPAVDQVLAAVGLLDTQVTTQINIAIDEQQLAAIDSISQGLGEIPPDVGVALQVALNDKDPDTALRILNEQLAGLADPKHVSFTIDPDTGNMDVVFENLAGPHDPAEVGVELTDAEATAQQLDEIADPRTAEVAVDDRGTVDDFAADADTATADRTTQVIVPKSDSLGQMQELIDQVARPRTVPLTVTADNAGAINGILDEVASWREVPMWVSVDAQNAMRTLDIVDDPRYVHVYVVTHGAAAANAAIPGTAVATTARGAPAPAQMTFNAPITLNAAVIGDRYDVQRTVTRALRGAIRIGGARLAGAEAAA